MGERLKGGEKLKGNGNGGARSVGGVPKEMKIQVDPALKEAYATFAVITHSKREFVVDFCFDFQGQAKVVSRVVLSPAHAKEFSRALAENIESFEKNVGKIG